MSRPPRYPDLQPPSPPHWARWWLALVVSWSLYSAALLALWPDQQPRLQLWLWGALLPLGWAVALALRHLGWLIQQHRWARWQQAREAGEQQWWQRRSLGLPVEALLLIGPAGECQAAYQGLMKDTRPPQPVALPGLPGPVLPCSLALTVLERRSARLGQQLARLTLGWPGLPERWAHLRGVVWAGDAAGEAGYVQALIEGGATLPAARVSLHDLADLDALIDGFYAHCRHEADWLLCAGVMPLQATSDTVLPLGEGGFAWQVSWHGKQMLHRGNLLGGDSDATAAELCAQVQRTAQLEAAPPACVALDPASQRAFVCTGWPVQEHELSAHWGALGTFAPFIGMSLALLQAQAGQPCGWLASDGHQRMAIGMAVPHGTL